MSVTRTNDVWAALDTVLDPELDESVVSLDFVSDVAVDGARVGVNFRLPTAWCSLNFAWMMAEDMEIALRSLDWVTQTDIRLVDHFAADRINAGIASGQGFAATFGPESGGDLSALRRTFRAKAYLGRMATLIDLLRKAGHGDESIAALSLGDLRTLKDNQALAGVVARFLELRAVFGGAATPDDTAFRTVDGETVGPDRLAAFLRDIRMTRRGVEANGEMCRVMLAARYGLAGEDTGARGDRARQAAAPSGDP